LSYIEEATCSSPLFFCPRRGVAEFEKLDRIRDRFVVRPRTVWTSWLLIAGLALFYPLIWLKPILPLYHVYSWQLFTPAWLGLLALLLILWCYAETVNLLRTWWIGWPLLVLGILSVIQVVWWGTDYSPEALLQGTFWLLVPLAAALCGERLVRPLHWAALVFWTVTAVLSFQSVFHPPVPLWGIPGNYNWNATLLASTVLLVVGWLWRGDRPLSGGRRWLALVLVGVTLYLMYRCTCKGALLVVLGTALWFYWFECRRLRRYLTVLAMIGLVVAGIFFGSIWQRFSAMDQGVRTGLGSGAVSTVARFWWQGTSAAGFETSFAELLPPEYQSSPMSAPRSNHPHNQILYQFAVWGVMGGTAWLVLLLLPFWRFFRHYPQRGREEKLQMAAMMVIFGHGMLDLTLFEWPTNVFFLLLLGLLWYRRQTGGESDRNRLLALVRPTRLLRGLTGLAALAVLADGLYRTAVGTWYFREAQLAADWKKHEMTGAMIDEGLKLCPANATFLYKAGTTAMYELHNPALALTYFRHLDGLNRNFAQNNGLTGQLLLLQGHPDEALPYLAAEIKLHPINVLPHFYYSIALGRLGLRTESEQEFRTVIMLLRFRGLEPRDLPFLIQNSYYDRRWREMPDTARQR